MRSNTTVGWEDAIAGRPVTENEDKGGKWARLLLAIATDNPIALYMNP
ncbi:hypothetical protein H6F95_04235 [Cyanobacteria bacterium FACHB-471]|nr:hypothetical protein [Cyanobacteria bacterium FACHB-471]